MNNKDLNEVAHRRPFEPFRVTLTTGETYDIRHPDLILVGRRSAILGIPSEPARELFDRSIKVDLLHIVAIEDLPVKPPSTNGPAA
jgi:hypothetical protein